MYQSGEDVARAFVDRWSAHDAGGLADLFEDRADFVNVTGIRWRSRTAIRKAHAYGFENIFAKARLQLNDLSTRELAPGLDLVHCTVTLAGQTAPDGQLAGDRVAFLGMVARRGDAGYRLVSCQNTDRVPGADTHVVGPDGFRPASYRKGQAGAR